MTGRREGALAPFCFVCSLCSLEAQRSSGICNGTPNLVELRSCRDVTYDPKWRREDERRMEWLDKLYRLDGRHHGYHPKHCLFTGLVQKYGAMPWKVS